MHRFFIPKEWIEDKEVNLSGKIIYQLRRVLRLTPNTHITVLDNTGWEYEVAIDSLTRYNAKGTVITKHFSKGEPRTRITLYQAILRKSRFEYVLQKCTELGIANFVPIICERCVAKWDNSKLERWQQIIREAAEQSQRGLVPKLGNPLKFNDACVNADDNTFIAWEDEEETGIRDILVKNLKSAHVNKSAINIFIGPEGGFTPVEVDTAQSAGIASFSLGKRVLRAETAGLVASSIILYTLGDLGG
jgi:16S rRNA (uracil1498-N3)-methyltransferase